MWHKILIKQNIDRGVIYQWRKLFLAHRCNVTTFYWYLYLKYILLIIDLSFSVLMTFLYIKFIIKDKNIRPWPFLQHVRQRFSSILLSMFQKVWPLTLISTVHRSDYRTWYFLSLAYPPNSLSTCRLLDSRAKLFWWL